MTKILAFAGSLRKDSFNKKLVKLAAEGAKNKGAEVTYIDLADYPLPIYDGDLEQSSGLPENAKKLKDIFKDHQALLIASPEYNSSLSAALKNTIDWVSRPVQGEPPLSCFRGKVAGIMSASPGALGGLRGLVHLRAILENIATIVVTEQVSVNKAGEAFEEHGALKDMKQQQSVENIGARVAEVSAKLNAVQPVPSESRH